MSNDHGPAAHGSESKSGAKQSVAVIGFIVIAVLGMAIAVYASRFVPGALSGLAGAGAYVSNLFILEEDNGKTTVKETPAKEETPAEEEAPAAATSTPSTPAKPVTQRPVTPTYSGLSDLVVQINAVGYCTTGAQNSLIPSDVVPDNARYGGVRFTVTNIGTNVSGSWAFSIETAAANSDTYEYAGQASLAPGQSAIGTMCFPRGTRANDGEVTVVVDSKNRVLEQNENNNDDSEDLEIESWD